MERLLLYRGPATRQLQNEMRRGRLAELDDAAPPSGDSLARPFRHPAANPNRRSARWAAATMRIECDDQGGLRKHNGKVTPLPQLGRSIPRKGSTLNASALA